MTEPDRLEALVAAVEGLADADARAKAQELVAFVLDLHGAALTRLLEIVQEADGSAATALSRIASDDLLAPVLELHDLRRPPGETAKVSFLPTRSS
jgi:hypothetical protein